MDNYNKQAGLNMKILLTISLKEYLNLLKKIVALSIILPATVFAGSWQQNESIGGFNKVHIYTPDSTSTIGDGKSLLIVLHGCVQPIDNYLTANLETAAEAHGMVIAVPDAMNKAGFSCWSYWQGAINRNSADYKNLVSLAKEMSGDISRNIDSDQVYIAGLSSGAAMAAQTACVAPDIFAGVAPSAGPTIGTSSNGAITTCETVSSATFKSRCESYAGSYQSHFETQIAVIGHGTADTTVNTCYNQQNADGIASVYGVSQLSGSNTISDSPSNTASETLWQDNRVAMLWFDNLDHSWSGGQGASGGYVAGNSINFASYLGDFFTANNKRVDRNQGPEISNAQASEQNSAIYILGDVSDQEGTVSTVVITIKGLNSGTPVVVETLNASINGQTFTAQSVVLADGLYQVEIIATDNEAKAGDLVNLTVRVGPEPPETSPVLSGINAVVAAQCAEITGAVVDINQNLDSVDVTFVNGIVVATVNDSTYRAEQCNLPGGANNAFVTATDSAGLTANDSVSFNIDAGVTGDYNLHINQGHITWGAGYSACYLAFGTSDFVMREYPAGTNQCKWIADGAPSCVGPEQACTTDPSVDQDSDNDGVLDVNDNCPNDPNSNQADNDNDGIGNVCDSSPDGEPTDIDSDNDGVSDSIDRCPNDAHASRADDDNDGIGNVCDSSPDPVFTCQEFTSSNYLHVQAKRATTNGYYAYAIGSGEKLGLYNIFYFSTLAQTSQSYFNLGTCP